MVKALVCTMAVASCQLDSRHHSSEVTEATAAIQVTRISPTVIDTMSSAQSTAPEICESWTLNSAQAARFLELSEQIDLRTYIHTYDTLPCKITGTAIIQGQLLRFEINGAAKAAVGEGDDVRYYGCSVAACEPLVMMMPHHLDAEW